MLVAYQLPSDIIDITRNLPVLGRWFEFQLLVWLSLSRFGVEDHPNHFWAGRTESIPFRHQRPPRPLLGRSGCVYLIQVSKATNTFSGPVGLCLSHSGVEELPRPLRGRSGRILLIPASKVYLKHFYGRSGCIYLILGSTATKTTSGPVGLYLSYFGVDKLPRKLRG
jgi:hypothetical protein